MKRCAVCQVLCENALCNGCCSLIQAPINPCQICAKPLVQTHGVTKQKTDLVGAFQRTKGFSSVNNESCDAGFCPEDERREVRLLICGECRSDPPSFIQTICAGIYEPPISLWVQQLKFGDRLDRARIMAEALLEPLGAVDACIPIIPIPLHPTRLRTRGYNQAFEVAKIIAKKQKRHLIANALVRTRSTAMQAELHEKQRGANVRGAFAVVRPVKESTVLVLDDVMTTGQTMRSVAKCLVKSGVKQVVAVVFARSGN